VPGGGHERAHPTGAARGDRRARAVFVSAGAGTGKTPVLVERFVRAVCDRGLDVDSMLVITYTERAAGELRGASARAARAAAARPRARARRRLDLDDPRLLLRLLKAYPFAAGLDPRFRVLDESQARVLAGEAFEPRSTSSAPRATATAPPARDVRRRGLRRMLTGRLRDARSAAGARSS
jgi:superfamily I DNA/RNA helicase